MAFIKKAVNVQELQCLGSCNIDLRPIILMDTNLHFRKPFQISATYSNYATGAELDFKRKCGEREGGKKKKYSMYAIAQ